MRTPATVCKRLSQAQADCIKKCGMKMASTAHISTKARLRGIRTAPRKSVTTNETTAASHTAIASNESFEPMAKRIAPSVVSAAMTTESRFLSSTGIIPL